MSISSKTHYCKGLEKGDWFFVLAYSCQSEKWVVEKLNSFSEPGLVYKYKSDFKPINNKG